MPDSSATPRLARLFTLSRVLLGTMVLLLALPFTCTSGRSAGDVIELTIWTSFDEPSEAVLFTDQVRRFEQEHPGISVKVEQVGASRRSQKYLAAMQANAAADVIILHWKQVPLFAAKDMLVPLSPYVARDGYGIDDFFPSALNAYRYDGEQVALPEKGSTQLLFYNKTLFDEAGVAYPDDSWTFDDVVAAGERLTRRGADGRVTQIGLIPYDATSWVWSMGGEFADDALNHVRFTDPGTIAGVEFLWKLRHEWQITSRNLNARGQDAAEVEVFEKGGVAMAVGGPWNFAKYEAISGFDWDVALFPQGPGGRRTRYAAMGYGIWTGSEHPDAAWELVSTLLGREAMGERRGTGYADVPARRSVAYGEFAQQDAPFDMQVLLRSMDPEVADVMVLPKHEQWALLERYFYEELDRAMLGQLTPAEAMREAQGRAERVLAADRYEPGVADYVGLAAIPVLGFGAMGLVRLRGAGKRGAA